MVNSAGGLVAEYSWGLLGPLMRRPSSVNNIRYYIQDGLGHTRALLDNAGNVTDWYVYDAWGGLNNSLSSTPTANPFRWNAAFGYQFIAQTGLYHVGAREYDPRVGRWLQRDPIDVESGDPNLYRYCGNDPLNAVDPDGLDAGWARRKTPNDPYGNKSASQSASGALGQTVGGYTIGNKLPKNQIAYKPLKRGRPPYDKEGNPIELHHRDQNPHGPIDEMTRDDHRGPGNHKKNHPKRKSDVEHGPEWDAFRERHWGNEWDCGRFDDLPELPEELKEKKRKERQKRRMQELIDKYSRRPPFIPIPLPGRLPIPVPAL